MAVCASTRTKQRRRRRADECLICLLSLVHLTNTHALSATRFLPLLPSRTTFRLRSVLALPPTVTERNRVRVKHKQTFKSIQFSSVLPLFCATESAETSDEISCAASFNWTKETFAIAIPALIGMLADPVLSLIDTAYVGRLGSLELAALGSCTSIFHLAFNTFRATTAATTSLVANTLQESPEEAKAVTWISLKMGISIGLVLLMSLLIGGNFILNAMGVCQTTSPLYPAASSYLFTRCWAAPAILFIGVAEGAFRGYGNTITPLVASLTAAAINLILDPILMFKPIGWGVAGAAAATALSQLGAAAFYLRSLIWHKMLPRAQNAHKEDSSYNGTKQTATILDSKNTKRPPRYGAIIRNILMANLTMLAKQGSLLFGWAFASRRATWLGPDQIAAHQVGLSVWLVFALILDGAAVSAQVLMSRAYAQQDKPAVKSLIQYMVKFAIIQGLSSMLIMNGLDLIVPRLFTNDVNIQGHLHRIMPKLAMQQILVSLTLVVESLAVGGNQFQILAFGTSLATICSIWQISCQRTVAGIWGVGIVILFAGRLLTASIATWRMYRNIDVKLK